jgi:CDP-diacylglycerol--glycerol-3-phosphate 3-phosphatidyltransferase
MTTPSKPSGPNENSTAWKTPGTVPLSLRLQARVAATLLICPWLVTLFLCRRLFQQHSLALMALLPGLLVALSLQNVLLGHLTANHRSGEADRLFPSLGVANWITLLRAAAIVALAGFLPLAVHPAPAFPPHLVWAPGLIYLGISLADLLDGFVARRQHRETELGKRLDIETDAAGLLVALLVAVSLDRLPALTLLAGLAYYLFIFGIWWRRQRHLPLIALQSRPYSRIIAGIQMGLAAIALLPFFDPPFTFIAAYIVMTPLLVGFGRDWLVVSRRMQVNGNQQTNLDHWAGLILTRYLPLGLRLILLAGGIAAIVINTVSSASPFWLWVQSLFCLLAGLGFLGRCSALLLTLLLGCSLTPFGTEPLTLALFCTAATLMLTGTGPLSLWSPEERILYRRNLDGATVQGGSA